MLIGYNIKTCFEQIKAEKKTLCKHNHFYFMRPITAPCNLFIFVFIDNGICSGVVFLALSVSPCLSNISGFAASTRHNSRFATKFNKIGQQSLRDFATVALHI